MDELSTAIAYAAQETVNLVAEIQAQNDEGAVVPLHLALNGVELDVQKNMVRVSVKPDERVTLHVKVKDENKKPAKSEKKN